ncbi:hypothetical protein BN77_3651 [Rhizobium mesoamericanum STM3625]|uniref:Uncharacterized protein n=1 Tax=Rhizobium mesoamericanum STM3625 TaxID=1211777 RepID=K0PS12_9HYPH|nr:hypothetical protein BN77_3651 [Rhizobium mesoamericanum STM3625]
MPRKMAPGAKSVKSIIGDREPTGGLIQSKPLASSPAKPYLIHEGPKWP